MPSNKCPIQSANITLPCPCHCCDHQKWGRRSMVETTGEQARGTLTSMWTAQHLCCKTHASPLSPSPGLQNTVLFLLKSKNRECETSLFCSVIPLVLTKCLAPASSQSGHSVTFVPGANETSSSGTALDPLPTHHTPGLGTMPLTCFLHEPWGTHWASHSEVRVQLSLCR